MTYDQAIAHLANAATQRNCKLRAHFVQTNRGGEPICSAIAEKWIVAGMWEDRNQRKADRKQLRDAFADRTRPLNQFPDLVARQSQLTNTAGFEGYLEEDVKRDFERTWNPVLDFTVLKLNGAVGNTSWRSEFVKEVVEQLKSWNNSPRRPAYFLLTLDRVQENGQGHVVALKRGRCKGNMSSAQTYGIVDANFYEVRDIPETRLPELIEAHAEVAWFYSKEGTNIGGRSYGDYVYDTYCLHGVRAKDT